MGRTRRASGFRLLVLVCLVALSGTASAQTRLMLLSPDEAVRLRLGREEPWGAGPTVRGSTGPRILVQEPVVRQTSNGPVIETPPSMSFFIVFEANGSPVDMESLEIKAKHPAPTLKIDTVKLDFNYADFGDAAPGNRAILILNGWVDWPDGSTFRAAAQEF